MSTQHPDQHDKQASQPEQKRLVWPQGTVPEELYGLALVTEQGILPIATLDLGSPMPDTMPGQVEFASNCARQVITIIQTLTSEPGTWQEIALRLQREAEIEENQGEGKKEK